LANILSQAGPGWYEKSEEEREDLIRRSRIFYFNRYVTVFHLLYVPPIAHAAFRITGYSITVEDAVGYDSEQTLHTGLSPAVADQQQQPVSVLESPSTEPRILTFAEIKELIEQGKTDQIPNNRVIPNDLNVRIYIEACFDTLDVPVSCQMQLNTLCLLLPECTPERIDNSGKKKAVGEGLICRRNGGKPAVQMGIMYVL
jgi:hypothetical protein